MPYSPPKDAVRHTEPDGLHSFQCLSKHKCIASYTRWKDESQKLSMCDHAVSELEEALFHLHNLLQERKLPFLLIGTGSPKFWNISLSDLNSRIQGARNAQINEIDEKLFPLLMAKLFADRQMYPSPDVFEYLNRRIDRSFSSINIIVEKIDQISIEEKRPITRSLVCQMLKNYK